MTSFVPKILLVAAASALAVGASAAVEIGQPAPDFTLTDTHGKSHSLSDYTGKIVVLEWTNDGCPYVHNHYSSHHMQKMQQDYTAKGVVWLTICSSAPGTQGNHSPAEWERIRQEQGHASTALLLDESGKVGRLYSAKTTPHMFVIDQHGNLVYDGAIDSIPSTRPSSLDKAENYVAEALDAVMAGQPVPVSRSKPYGCSVKYQSDS